MGMTLPNHWIILSFQWAGDKWSISTQQHKDLVLVYTITQGFADRRENLAVLQKV
jgi:hypothetical protein